SAFGSIKSQLSTLSDAVNKLALASTWNAKTVASSDEKSVKATVTSGSSATISSFSIAVTKLARAQSVASAAIPSGVGVGSGTLSIQLGQWDTTGTPAFTAGSAAAVSVTVASTDTLSDIAGKINSAGAGVTATVLKDLSGDRLMLRSSSTGEATGFQIQASDDGTDTTHVGLQTLAFDAAGVGMAAQPIQYGQNAAATINGIPVTSASNTLDGTIPGLSMTLLQETTTPVEIKASTDTASMTTIIQSFVTAYNSMNQMFNDATKYDATTKTAALLQGDATTTGMQSALRKLIGASSGGGALKHLSDLGISIAKDGAGALSIDSGKLATALKDPAAVQQFFAAPKGESELATGFATRLYAFTRDAVGSDSVLAGKTESLQAQKSGNGKQQDRVSDRLTITEARLRKQYATLDTTMASMTALNTYITQQIAQWNKSTS
ncbi:MAG: flagellar filament capping protein FliD, partial [Burkholderiaceae bacterium]